MGQYRESGYAILAGDESPHIPGWNAKNGRYRKGKPVTTPVSLSRDRFHSFGALSEDGSECTFYGKADSTSFAGFLARLYRKHGRFVTYVDNASYHKSKKINEELAKYGGGIVLEYFLPYTPELNPVEIQWKGIKKGTANTLYGTEEEMQESIRTMLGNGEVKAVKMVNYLT